MSLYRFWKQDAFAQAGFLIALSAGSADQGRLWSWVKQVRCKNHGAGSHLPHSFF